MRPAVQATKRVAPARISSGGVGRLLGIAVALFGFAFSGCAGLDGVMSGGGNYGWLGQQNAPRTAGDAMVVDWNRRLANREIASGHYVPVEYASAVLDPPRDRVYIGSTDGKLLAFESGGRRVYQYAAGGAIEAAPALDAERQELFLATEEGKLHALNAERGTLRWEQEIGNPVRRTPVLADDAVYVATQKDEIVAFARDNGDVLWTYSRPLPDGFAISTHAGVLLHDGHIISGFTDGAVVALDATDGRLVWEIATSLDVEEEPGSQQRFLDVDTTPILVDGLLYVASFSAGLYALNPRNGTVLYRKAEYPGIVGLTSFEDRIVMTSADFGVACIRADDQTEYWRRGDLRGTPSEPVVSGGTVLVGEADGSMLALDLVDGVERGRINAGTGFSAPATAAHGRGFALSNGGSFFAFRLR